jgi:hypothetical protein
MEDLTIVRYYGVVGCRSKYNIFGQLRDVGNAVDQFNDEWTQIRPRTVKNSTGCQQVSAEGQQERSDKAFSLSMKVVF